MEIDTERMARLKGNPLSLYLLILAVAQRTSSPTVKITSEQMRQIGISKNYVTPAAKTLADEGLVSMVQRKGKDWGFEFELLDVGTGLPVPSLYGRKIDITTVTQKQIHDYFLTRLLTYYDHEDDNGFMARCPFHPSENKKPTLSIKTTGTGVWKCHEATCDHHEGGSLIDFEVAYTHRNGGRLLNATTAWERITSAMRGAQRKEDVMAASLHEANETMAAFA
jgi:Zn-finger protein